jgi:hypothetical protein
VSDSIFLILTGPPGAGKTTIGRLVAGEFDHSAVIEFDFFWASIVNGLIEPWEPESMVQNRLMLRASLASAVRFSEAGYATVLEGMFTPQHFDLIREELAALEAPIHYVVLRPTLEDCLFRSVDRLKEPRHAGALTLAEPIRHMYSRFERLDAYERNVIDNSALSLEETVRLIVEGVSSPDTFLLTS